jgi:hypothetical protein
MSREQKQNNVSEHPQQMYSLPPFKKQKQDSPGMENKMEPKPDYGRQTYQGNEKLKDKVKQTIHIHEYIQT